ncbi:MAG: AMP-binding protein, partial [Kutzneria sp.]|nr:AMP-binding protein [Kutzneria sp.]
MTAKTKPEELFSSIALRAERNNAPLFLPSDVRPYSGSWGELCATAAEAAGWLELAGVRAGDVVALSAEPRAGTLATILAAWKLNASITILATPSGAKRAAHSYPEWLGGRLGQIRAKLVVTDRDDGGIDWPAVTAPGPHGVRALRNPAEPSPLDDLAAIGQLTSGSTGDPKIVPVTADAVLANVAAIAARFGLTDADSVVSWLPLSHDMGLIGTFALPALLGLPLHLSSPDSFVRNPTGWLVDIARLRATLTFAPNFAYSLAARHAQLRSREEKLDLSTLRHCVNGSEPIHAREFATFGEFAARHGMPVTALRPGYGMAEVGLVLTAVEPGQPMRVLTVEANSLTDGSTVRVAGSGIDLVGCGKPLPGYRISVRSRDGEPLPERTVGEICAHGPSLFTGYLGQGGTESFWPDGFHRTGDLGFVCDGEVFVCGRIKDIIIVRGENLVPQEIEHQVATVDGVRRGNVAAFGIRGDDRAEG